MARLPLSAACAAAVFLFVAKATTAGPIETACLRSDRDNASRALCGCIQAVADQTLKGSDQRRAAKFFKDPDAAHAVWVSQKPADDAFWERYKAFGDKAEMYCAR